jgi:amino acid adenylation domain-containing protein
MQPEPSLEEKRALAARLLRQRIAAAERSLPLSYPQRGIWLAYRLAPESPAYNVGFAARVSPAPASPEVEKLGAALSMLVARHPALRATYRLGEEGPEQRIHPRSEIEVERIEVGEGDDLRREVEWAHRRPFDLERGPVLRLTLVSAPAGETVLLLSAHHIAVDFWSLLTLLDELRTLYAAAVAGSPAPALPRFAPYADFARAQAELLAGPEGERLLRHWAGRLGDASTTLELPADRRRPAVASHDGSSRPFRLGRELSTRIKAWAQGEEITLFMLLLTAWYALLHRYSRQERIVVGSPVSGRDRAEYAGTVGPFINMLPLALDLSGDGTFAVLARQVRQTVLDGLAHQELPFEALIEKLGLARDPGMPPLFQTTLTLQQPHRFSEITDLYAGGESPVDFGGLTLRPFPLPQQEGQVDLGLEALDNRGELVGVLKYATDLFDAVTVDRLLGHLRTLLAGALGAPERRLAELPLLSPAERFALLSEWSAAATADAAFEPCLDLLFTRQAERTPNGVAVEMAGLTLTYGELARRARRLAAELIAAGVGPETRVGVGMERSLEGTVAILGILEAGAAFVPLDPELPEERLRFMLDDARVELVITQERLRERLPLAGRPALCLEAGWGVEERPYPAPARRTTAESLAYVLYTSGSTGRPKGVMIPHRAIFNRVWWMQEAYPHGPADRVLQKTALTFDASLWELFLPWMSGGTVVLARPGGQRDPAYLAAAVVEQGITTLQLVPSLLRVVLEEPRSAEWRGTLHRMFCGGEALPPELQQRFFDRVGVELANLYGPTETAIDAAAMTCRRGETGGRVLIGRPIANDSVQVLDSELQPTPIGVPGEIHIGGRGVGRGYASRPDLSAERFLPDPHGGRAGARLYRTGDLGRYLRNGEIEYLGRADHQVKVRGMRIELGEIESLLASHPRLREAVVLAAADSRGELQLTAYVVPTGGPLAAGELRRFLRASLPDAMLPGRFVELPALPRLTSGKLDRAALAPPVPVSLDPEAAAPRGPVEEVLAAIWAEVLGLARVGRSDGFFDLGGHSLSATRVASRVAGAFGIDLPLQDLFSAPTVAELAQLVERRLGAVAASTAPPIRRLGGSDLPLSFAQQRLWFLDQLAPGGSAYSVPTAVELLGTLVVPAVSAALREIVRRHESLRTTFALVADRPVQRIDPAPAAEFPVIDLAGLPVIDLAGLPRPARQAEVASLEHRLADRPFDLRRGPLLHMHLLRLGADRHRLEGAVHHIVADAWSAGILVRELAVLYEAAVAGRPSPLAELPIQYADFARWQREWLSGPVLDALLVHWRGALAGAPRLLSLPTDRPRPAVQTHRGGSGSLVLSAELCARLEAVGRQRTATLFMTLLAAFTAVLARHSGQPDQMVGTTVANRNRLETEGLIGFFVNMLALRVDGASDPTASDLLKRVREVALAAYTHQDLPFDLLVEDLQPERSLDHTPLFQVTFEMQAAPAADLDLAELTLRPLPVVPRIAPFDLAVLAERYGAGHAGLRLSYRYSTDLFDAATVTRLLGHFSVLLEGVVDRPGERISRLPLLAAAEAHQVCREWNDTAADFAAAGGMAPLDVLFAAQAARTPEAVAVVGESGRLLYRELDARSNQLARRLRALGVREEDRVGVCLERSLELVVALLGVLKAGAAYVPFDPDYPAARLAFIREGAEIGVVLSAAGLKDRFGAHPGALLLLDAGWEDFAGVSPAALDRPPRDLDLDLDRAAYVIYTSGSTGTPKGAVNTHRAVANRLAWMQAAFGLQASDRVLQKTPFSFDVSVWEFFWPLLTGARLVVARPGGHRESGYLADLMAAEGVTTVHFVPSMLQVFLEEPRLDRCGALRRVIVSGEALPGELEGRFGELLPCELHNLYGPTEAAIDVTWHACGGGGGLAPRPVPIGRPISNLAIHLLDGEGQPVPIGVAGELYIGGVGLARCYLGRADLTASRFVPDPLSVAPGARLYATGDLARCQPDGEIQFLGRLDHQVKIRGLRIELGEIESVLATHPAVREAVVVATADGRGDTRLTAYVVPTAAPGGEPLESEGLLRFLAGSLPSYMLPASFIELAEMPLLPSGKVDRRALPAPDGRERRQRTDFVPPATPTAQAVAEIWREVLGRERVGNGDDFFALGGHSLSATQVASRVTRVFAIDGPVLRALFKQPKLAGFAAWVDEQVRGGVAPPPPIGRRPEPDDRPLSFAQQRLWFLQQMAPESPFYHLAGGIHLAGDLDRQSLERSLAEIVCRHEVLRSVYPTDGGAARQEVLPPGGFALPMADLSGLAPDRREREAERIRASVAGQVLDLARGPLLRALLLRAGERDHLLLALLHHIVCDGWSLGVLTGELASLYPAFVAGRPSPLPPLAVQYADFASWQRRWLAGEVFASLLSYWKEQLADVPPVLDLPADRPRPAVQSFRGGAVALRLPEPLVSRLQAAGRREGATLFMTLLAVYSTLLHRCCRQDRLAVGSPIAGRNRLEIEPLIGCFINMLALRSDAADRPTFTELLARVHATTLGAYLHQDLPFERLVEELDTERDLSRSALFQAMFVLQNTVAKPFELPGLLLSAVAVASGTTQYDLALEVEEGAAGFAARLSYSTDLFDATTVARLLGHFSVLLEGVADRPGERIAQLPLLAAAEAHQVCREWNDTAADFSAARTAGTGEMGIAPLDVLFAAQAARTPEAIAVVGLGGSLLYRELDARSNQLARRLRALGVREEDRVGVCLERSLELVVALLGVLKAGAAYVPLDPDYPAARLAFIREGAEIGVVLSAAGLADRLGAHPGALLLLDADWEDFAGVSQAALDRSPRDLDLDLDRAAYVIYTSGSTGMPKGAVNTHRAVANRLAWMQAAFGLQASDRVLQKTPFSFDVSVWEFFWPLLTGARLVVARPGGHRESGYLADLMAAEGVTTVHFVPSMLQVFLEEPRLDRCGALRRVIVSGEALPGELEGRFGELLACELHNLYGPTEAAIDVTWHACGGGGGGLAPRPVPIGRPISNLAIHLLDGEGQPVPIGVAGELYIGGVGLARCYLGRADLTASRFVPDPLSVTPGARLYATGDLARCQPDGEIQFLGRLDHQVKIRGLRIELGEIESVLATHPAVRESTVTVVGEGPVEQRLVAYFVSPGPQAPKPEELREFLQARLPAFSVPAAFVHLTAMPLSANGKVDRRALPAPEGLRDVAVGLYAAPGTAVEERLAAVWEEVLGVPRIGIHDNFFALGGNSLHGLRMVALAKEGGLEVDLQQLFLHRTIADLAREIDRRGPSGAPSVTPAAEAAEEMDDMAELLRQIEELTEEEARERLLS